jgi:HEAT repeat protein
MLHDLEALATRLNDSDPRVRLSAMQAIAQFGRAAAIPAILSGLHRAFSADDPLIRRAAAEAIGAIGLAAITPEITVGIAALLRDSEAERFVGPRPTRSMPLAPRWRPQKSSSR